MKYYTLYEKWQEKSFKTSKSGTKFRGSKQQTRVILSVTFEGVDGFGHLILVLPTLIRAGKECFQKDIVIF